jgi:hypothetical protein
MRVVLAFSALIAVAAPTAISQQLASIPKPERVTLANGAPNLVAPVLRPLQIDPPPTPACQGTTLTGSIAFLLVVDDKGQPRNIIFDKPLRNEADYLAVRLMQNHKLDPATLNGSPVAVAGSVHMQLSACVEQKADQKGHVSTLLRPLAIPNTEFSISPHAETYAMLTPVSGSPIIPSSLKQSNSHITFPEFIKSEEPLIDGLEGPGKCLFSVVIDEHGLPQKVHAAECSSVDFDQRASEIVGRYRFIPATKDGMPLPMEFPLEIVRPKPGAH